MTLDQENITMADIYHTLDDGRILELRSGPQSESDHAIWARNLSDSEKATYLHLKDLGYSDMDIYEQLNRKVNKKTYA